MSRARSRASVRFLPPTSSTVLPLAVQAWEPGVGDRRRVADDGDRAVVHQDPSAASRLITIELWAASPNTVSTPELNVAVVAALPDTAVPAITPAASTVLASSQYRPG